MTVFEKVAVYTDADGRARLRSEAVPSGEGSPRAMLSGPSACGGYQLRQSPPGFRGQWLA